MGGGTGQKTEHCQENVFRTPRYSLLRDQIFSFISKVFFFFFVPKWGDHRGDATEGSASWKSLELPWPVLEFLPPGVLIVPSQL